MNNLNLDLDDADAALVAMQKCHSMISDAIESIQTYVQNDLRDGHNWSSSSAFSFFDKIENLHLNFSKQLEQLESVTTQLKGEIDQWKEADNKLYQ
jgi:hypothetical protein